MVMSSGNESVMSGQWNQYQTTDVVVLYMLDIRCHWAVAAPRLPNINKMMMR